MAQYSSEPQASQQLFELLKKDHRQAEQVMQQIASASSPQKREELFLGLKDMLTQHMVMEEKFFYPKLEKIQEMTDMMQDALDEHQEAKDLMEELEDMEPDDEDWLSTFQDLQDGVKHHVEDEETEVFPECRKYFKEQQFSEMFRKCTEMKERAASEAKAAAGGRKQAKKQPAA